MARSSSLLSLKLIIAASFAVLGIVLVVVISETTTVNMAKFEMNLANDRVELLKTTGECKDLGPMCQDPVLRGHIDKVRVLRSNLGPLTAGSNRKIDDFLYKADNGQVVTVHKPLSQ